MGHLTETFALNSYPSKGEIVVLFAGSAQTEPLHPTGPKVHDYYLVHYVISGKGTFQCLGKSYDLVAGDSFYIFPGELVSYYSDEHDPWQYCWIGFRGNTIDMQLSQIGISAQKPIVTTGQQRKIHSRFLLLHRALERNEPGCDLQAGGYMRLLLAEYAKYTNYQPSRRVEADTEIEQQIEHAIRWLTLQYYQPISIEKMAQSLGYHRTHLSKMFKQYTGLSPMNFLLKIRMERAKLLLAGRLTIEQVASSVGFTDALYFSKQFKKWQGSTPTEFRNKLIHRNPFDCRTF